MKPLTTIRAHADHYAIGPTYVSHDNGDTWHLDGEACDVCEAPESDEGGLTVLGVDRATGTITVG